MNTKILFHEILPQKTPVVLVCICNPTKGFEGNLAIISKTYSQTRDSPKAADFSNLTKKT